MQYLDHILYIHPNLDDACQTLFDLTGVEATFGGRHGTGLSHNAILSLGPHCYLELLSPLPGIKSGEPWIETCIRDGAPRVDTFCMRSPHTLPSLADGARRDGLACAGPEPWSRTTPSGDVLRWTMLTPEIANTNPLVPFFIDWGDTTHPAKTAPTGVTLDHFTIFSRNTAELKKTYNAFGLNDLDVQEADNDYFEVCLNTSRGPIVLR